MWLQAARAGHLDVVEQLLDYGANVPGWVMECELAEPVKDLLERHLLKYLPATFVIVSNCRLSHYFFQCSGVLASEG